MTVPVHYAFVIALVLFTCSCVHRRTDSATASAQQADTTTGQVSPSATNWPARVGEKYAPKTFRFHPASVEWRPVPTRRLSYDIIFTIEDKNVPADYFIARCWDTEVDRFRKILEADDGYITVTAFWVNDKTPREDFKGAPEYWVDGRKLLGTLQTKP